MSAVDSTHKERWQNLKCCTFQPFIGNFLLGEPSVLTHAQSQLGNSGSVWWSPLGVFAKSNHREEQKLIADSQKNESSLCLFFDKKSKACGIWHSRPGECSSYFCQNLTDPELSQLSFEFEAMLAQWALIELGFAFDLVDQELEALNTGQPTPLCQGENATEWFEIYAQCFAWASQLEPKQVQEFCELNKPARANRRRVFKSSDLGGALQKTN